MHNVLWFFRSSHAVSQNWSLPRHIQCTALVSFNKILSETHAFNMFLEHLRVAKTFVYHTLMPQFDGAGMTLFLHSTLVASTLPPRSLLSNRILSGLIAVGRLFHHLIELCLSLQNEAPHLFLSAWLLNKKINPFPVCIRPLLIRLHNLNLVHF